MFVLVGSLIGQAEAKPRLPKHDSVPDVPETNIFSSPDAQPDVTPGFIGKGGQPIRMMSDDSLPGFSHARMLQNLTPAQRKSVDKLQADTNSRVQAIQEHIQVLNQRLDVAKAHPNEVIYVQNEPLPRPADIKAEIAELRRKIERKRADALIQLGIILTEEQMQQIRRMRQGELLRPLPDAVAVEEPNNKKHRTIFGAFRRKVRESK